MWLFIEETMPKVEDRWKEAQRLTESILKFLKSKVAQVGEDLRKHFLSAVSY